MIATSGGVGPMVAPKTPKKKKSTSASAKSIPGAKRSAPANTQRKQSTYSNAPY